MQQDIIRKYAAPVPRYTSYPTAPHFSPRVDARTYGRWLDELPEGIPLSLYVHVPYCTKLCWYCGCNTKATRRYAPVANYVDALKREIMMVAARVPQRHSVAHMHWGGGSPNILSAYDIRDLAAQLRQNFNCDRDMELAVEIDPRDFDAPRADALHDAGVTRISLGVQDFREDVQNAIGRLQSFDDTARVIDAFRSRGIASINIDLVYGLPLQTVESVDETIGKVITLSPDRVAIFGYAHLPERLRHQRLIDTKALPDAVMRFAQAGRMAERLVDAGYVRVGLDHYAKPGDSLATGAVSRNFQGYTSDDVETLIGLGASAIGQFPQGFVQNVTGAGDYARRIAEGELATARGFELTEEDKARGWVIRELMCTMRFSHAKLREKFGTRADHLIEVAHEVIADDTDNLIEPEADGFRVRDEGRTFLRSICARFDAYLPRSAARHATGV